MFCKSIKSNKYWATMTVVGIITLIFIGIAYKDISDDNHNIAMLKGMFFGLGAAFTVMGTVKLIQNKTLTESKLRQKEIELKDERNIQVLRTSYTTANTVATILFAIMGFLFVSLNYIVPALISMVAMNIQALVFFIAYRYFNNKM